MCLTPDCAHLCGLPDIMDAVVSLATGGPSSGDRLIAHLVMMPDAPPLDPSGLRDRLGNLLPTYMLPAVFLPVSDIPRNANGKHDRDALPLPPQLMLPPKARTAGNATEDRLMALIAEQTGAGFITGTRDSLAAAGIDSLAMANLLFSIEDAFGITLDTGFDVGFDTVEVLALMVDSRLKVAPSPSRKGLEQTLTGQITPHLATWPGLRSGKAGLALWAMPHVSHSRHSFHEWIIFNV